MAGGPKFTTTTKSIMQKSSFKRPDSDDMGTGIAKTILKVFAAAVAISAALLAAVVLLSR